MWCWDGTRLLHRDSTSSATAHQLGWGHFLSVSMHPHCPLIPGPGVLCTPQFCLHPGCQPVRQRPSQDHEPERDGATLLPVRAHHHFPNPAGPGHRSDWGREGPRERGHLRRYGVQRLMPSHPWQVSLGVWDSSALTRGSRQRKPSRD